MAHTLLLKRSTTTTATPTSGQLSAGELAINTTDEAIFFKNNAGSVKALSAMSDLTSNLVTIASNQTISGTKTFSAAVTLTNDLFINGGALRSSSSSMTMFATNVATLDVGLVATTVNIGAAASTTTSIRGGTLVGNTATQNVFNATATTVNAFGAGTSITFGGTSGFTNIRNTTTKLGNTTATLTTTNNGTTTAANHLTVSPYGDLILAPNADVTIGGSRPSILIENDDAGTGRIRLGGGNVQILATTDALESSAPALLQFYDSDLTNYVALRANSSIGTNNIYTLPASVGSANQVLSISSVAGNDATLTWTTVSAGGSPGGSDTQVQFNDGGSTFGGDAGLTYNKTTDTLTVTGDVAVNGGDLTTTAGTATIFNSNATTLSIGGATSSTINVGATGGTSTIDMNKNIFKRPEMRGYFESLGTVTYTGGKVQDLSVDLSTGNLFVYTTTGTIVTFSVTNLPSKANTSVGFTIVLTCGDNLYDVDFGTVASTTVKWAGGTAPTNSNVAGRTDVVSYVTYDGGTTWYGFVGGLNFQ